MNESATVERSRNAPVSSPRPGAPSFPSGAVLPGINSVAAIQSPADHLSVPFPINGPALLLQRGIAESCYDRVIRKDDACGIPMPWTQSVSLRSSSRSVVRFYNKRGTAEQWIKEGKQATHWTRLSCHRFRANEVRLQLSVLAYNLGNLWRRLGLPHRIKSWSLTSLQQRLMKTGGRLVKHARYYWLLLAEGHLNRKLFEAMLGRIWALPVPGG